MAVNSWSHSKLVDFEKCKFMFWLKHDQRIPEPERELRPGQTEHANDRGSRVHESCEHYITGKSNELAPEAEKHFGPQIDLLRVLHDEGQVSVEHEWGHDKNWDPAPWAKAWLRLKLDAFVHLSDTEGIAIDFKTGKKYGNEIKHGEQLQLYQLCAFLRYPKLEVIHTHLWYLDIGETTVRTFTRDQGLRFKTGLNNRGKAVTTCTEFPPNPNVYSCQWCQYGPWNSGHCQEGVRK